MTQFDEVADIYDEHLKELLGGSDIEKYAEYKIQLAKIVSNKNHGKLLDFGCGTGRSFPYLLKYFPNMEIYGCDVSEKSINLAKKYVKEDNLFVNDTLKTLSSKGKMDIVIAACVFHHIPPEERIDWINAVVDILNKQGMFFIFEHNTKNPMTKKIILDSRNLIDDINWMLSHEQLVKMANKIPNSKVIWDGYTLFSPWRTKYTTNIERILKWLPIGAQHCVVIGKNI